MPRYGPDYDIDTPEKLFGIVRGRELVERFQRIEREAVATGSYTRGTSSPDAPCACPDPPRRRPVVVHGLTEAERQLLATGPPPPPPVAVRGQARRGRTATLAAVRARRPDLAKRLVASGYRPHPVDPHRRPTWNGGDSYHDLVAYGGRLS